MPVERCTKDGKEGYKSHTNGTCFTGPGSRMRAEQQLRAIKASQDRERKKRK